MHESILLSWYVRSSQLGWLQGRTEQFAWIMISIQFWTRNFVANSIMFLQICVPCFRRRENSESSYIGVSGEGVSMIFSPYACFDKTTKKFSPDAGLSWEMWWHHRNAGSLVYLFRCVWEYLSDSIHSRRDTGMHYSLCFRKEIKIINPSSVCRCLLPYCYSKKAGLEIVLSKGYFAHSQIFLGQSFRNLPSERSLWSFALIVERDRYQSTAC